MEVSNEIKNAVAENAEVTEEVTNGSEKRTFKKSTKPFKREKREFVNLEGTVETFREQLGLDKDAEVTVELIEEENETEYTNLYCPSSSLELNVNALAQRIAWYYTKFCAKNANFYNLSTLVEQGVKVVVKGTELNTDTAQKKFIVYHPAYNQLEMYVIGRLALDMVGKRIPNLRGIKKVGVIKVSTVEAE